MKTFIESVFKKILNKDVRVLYNVYDGYEDGDDNAYSIFAMNPSNEMLTDDNLKNNISPEFEIYQLNKTKEWLYTILRQTYYGNYWQPPEWDMVESTETYKNIDIALLALINQMIKDNFDDLLMCREEAKHNEEYLKERKN